MLQARISLTLSPFVSIIHRFRQVFHTTSCICTELLLVNSYWSANTAISKYSCFLTKSLRMVPSVLITINITDTFKLLSFLSFLTRSKNLSLFSLSLIFTLWSATMAKSSFFIFIYLFVHFCLQSQIPVFWPRLDDFFVSQNPCEFCESYSPGQILFCTYDQILISCTIPIGSPSPPRHVLSSTPFAAFAYNVINLFLTITI